MIKILFLDDVYSDVELALAEINKEKLEYDYRCVDNETDFRAALVEYKPSIVVSDYSLLGFSGLDALKISLTYDRNMPFILLTGSIDEETAVNIMKQGASDYVLKDHMKKLPIAIIEAILQKEIKIAHENAEKALRLSEERFRLIAENARDMIYLIEFEPNPCFKYVSPYTTILTGYTPEEHYADFNIRTKYIHPDDVHLIELDEILNNSNPQPIILRIQKKSGEMGWIEQQNVVIYDDDGKIKAIEGIARDITDRKTAEVELIKAKVKAEQSARLKSAFLANMSHEIRTPMNGLVGFSSLISEKDITEEERLIYAEEINKSCKRLLDIVTNVLDISKIESGQMEVIKTPFNVHEALVETYCAYKQQCIENGLQFFFSIELENKDLQIENDKGKIQQILSIFLNNAIKFTKTGRIDLKLIQNKDELVFYVQDTGIGISKSAQKSIFEHFTQEDSLISRNYDGAGLGLSIAKGLCELIGGSITFESVKGRGSVFYLHVPISETKKTQIIMPSVAFPMQFSNINKEFTILIAEDDELSFDFLKKLLNKNEKFKIIRAKDGIQAVDCCKENPDISMVLMDIKMPFMNGLEATKKIKAQRKDLPIIAVTAYALSNDIENAFAAGCDDYISKPFAAADIMKVIGNYTVQAKPYRDF
jgi:PAS domain S-box-containing protein